MGRVKNVSEIIEISKSHKKSPDKMAFKIITKKIDRAMKFRAENGHTSLSIQIPALLMSIPEFNRKTLTAKVYHHYLELGFDCNKSIDDDRYKLLISWTGGVSSESEGETSSDEETDSSIDFGEGSDKKNDDDDDDEPGEVKKITFSKKESLASRVKNL